MKIGVDIRCLSEGKKTGVEEYTISLLESVLEKDVQNEYILFLNSFSNPKANLDFLKKYPNVRIKKFGFPNKILNLFFWYFGYPQIDKLLGGVDVFFLPNLNFGSFGKKTKVVLTIHDLSFERYPETFSLKRRLWHFFINPKKLCQRADKIIAVSQSTAQDIASLYKIDPSKIKVIASGINSEIKVMGRNDLEMVRVKEKYNLPYKFILYFGTVEPRKNIIGLINAFEYLRKEAGEGELGKYKLVIAGENGWKSKEIYQEIAQSEYKNDILVLGPISEPNKVYLYNLATLFVYPSFFEGFGFPPLEAMACGVPVITSNNSSLPEVVGEAAIMIDPDRPDEIYQAMREILSNKELQAKLREKGLERAKKFNWSKTADEFMGAY